MPKKPGKHAKSIEKAREIIKRRHVSVVEFDELYCDMLVEHMKKGFSFNSFGATIGASALTLRRWRELYDSFDEAAKLGESHSLHYWEKILVTSAAGKLKGHNGKLIELVLKCRFLWTEKQHIELTGSLETELRRLSDKELEIKLRSITAKQTDFIGSDAEDDARLDKALDKLKE